MDNAAADRQSLDAARNELQQSVERQTGLSSFQDRYLASQKQLANAVKEKSILTAKVFEHGLQRCRGTLSHVQRQNTNLCNARDQAETQLRDAEEESSRLLEDAKAQLSGSDDQKRKLATSLEESERKLARCESQNLQDAKKITQLDGNLKTVRHSNEELSRRLKDGNDLYTSIGDQKARLVHAQEDIDGLTSECEELRDELAGANNELTSLRDEKANMMDELAIARTQAADLESAQNRVKELETRHVKLEEERNRLAKEVRDLKSSVDNEVAAKDEVFDNWQVYWHQEEGNWKQEREELVGKSDYWKLEAGTRQTGPREETSAFRARKVQE